MLRHSLSDEQWALIQPLLPPEKPPLGRPSISHRRFFNALLWLVRTGAPWRDLPVEFGPWETIATRFYRWRKNGTLFKAFKALQGQAEARGLLDWEMYCIDSTVIRAHQHAAGGKKGLRERSGAVEEGSVRRAICALIAKATRSRSLLRAVSSTTRRSS